MRIDELLNRHEPEKRITIGIGAAKGTEKIIEDSISRAQKGANIECNIFVSEEALVRSLLKREVACAVRGTLAASGALGLLRNSCKAKALRAALMEDARGRAFLLAPVGIDEGNTLFERSKLVKLCIEFLSTFGIEPKIGILSNGRTEDRSRARSIARSLENGEKLAMLARERGIDAKHYGILIEDALKEANCIIAPDGVSGNLIFRTLYFAGAGRAVGAPAIDIFPCLVYVDTSRAKTDYADAIMFGAALSDAARAALSKRSSILASRSRP